jgi:sugar lactone lactonase YvrE
MRLTLIFLALTAAAFAQQQKGPAMPPALGCGVHGDAEVICGTRAPEDLELTPDGKFLIVPQFVTGGPGGAGASAGAAGLYLFDLSKKTFAKLIAANEPLKDWGDAACPGPIGDALGPHGTSLVKRSNGKQQLYVVNHGGQSIEMYELKQAGTAWSIAWHGCVVSPGADYNDVAALTDGSFIATHPTGIPADPAQKGKQAGGGAFGGQPTGFLVRWAAGKETELPGTRTAYPNGVVATPDGKTAYYAVYASKEARRYDVRAQKETGVVKLDFMPDNLTWTKKGNLLAAGIKGINGECPAASGQFCRQAFAVDAIDPDKMTRKPVYDSNGKGVLIPGVSSALQVGNDVYIGAFEGDRIVKVAWKE